MKPPIDATLDVRGRGAEIEVRILGVLAIKVLDTENYKTAFEVLAGEIDGIVAVAREARARLEKKGFRKTARTRRKARRLPERGEVP